MNLLLVCVYAVLATVCAQGQPAKVRKFDVQSFARQVGQLYSKRIDALMFTAGQDPLILPFAQTEFQGALRTSGSIVMRDITLPAALVDFRTAGFMPRLVIYENGTHFITTKLTKWRLPFYFKGNIRYLGECGKCK